MIKNPFRQRRERSQVANHAVLILALLFALGPLVVLGFNSLKTSTEVMRNPLGIPTEIRLQNYVDAWREGRLSTTARNSGILVVGTVTGVLVLGGVAAFSLARLDPPGSNLFMVYMLGGSTLPTFLFLVPLYSLWRILGLIDTLQGLIIIYVALNAPFAIFLLRSYMVQIPRDFEDAARVDGASELAVLTRVILPLSWPGFLTVGLVVALGVWSEFQVALIFVHVPELFPVTTSYWYFTTGISRPATAGTGPSRVLRR
jgi:raffinose/stachyose/melibiose transport system permease protein